MKKSGIMLMAAAGAALLAPGAQAQTRGGFEIRAEVFDYGHRERQDGQVVVRDDGTFGSIGFSYVETIGGRAFLRSRLNLGFGSVDYRSDGAVIDEPGAGESRLDNLSQSTGHLELHIGKDFLVGTGGATITPFIGLGSRYLKDNSGGTETDDGLLGYDREVNYAYVPIGIEAATPVGRRNVLKLAAQYNWLAGGRAESKFSEIDPILPDVKVDLENGHGFQASAMLGIPIGRGQVNFGPFIRTWNIGESEKFVITDPEEPGESLVLVEPKNRTSELGLRVSYAF